MLSLGTTVAVLALIAGWLFHKFAKAHEEHEDRILDLERRLTALDGGEDDEDSVEATRARR